MKNNLLSLKEYIMVDRTINLAEFSLKTAGVGLSGAYILSQHKRLTALAQKLRTNTLPLEDKIEALGEIMSALSRQGLGHSALSYILTKK
jgi:hypothetical protein|tara:strand:- start:101 stop:370 length:270 start_codon:yes stop_codon:yes gene_type:complete